MRIAVKRLLWGSLLGMIALAGFVTWYVLHMGLVERVYVYQEGNARMRLEATSALRNILWSPPQEIPEGAAAPNPAPRAPHWESPVVVVNAMKGPKGDFDLFVRELASTGWSAAAPIAGINTEKDEVSPTLSPDGSLLYFASNREGGLGGFDIFMSRRGQKGWEKPVNLGARVNSPYDETGPAYHPGGAILVFATNRPRGFLLGPPAEWSDVPLEGWKAGVDQLAFVTRALKPGDVGKWADLQPLGPAASSANDRDPCFAPRGDFLYFSSSRGGGAGGFDIFRVRCRLEGDPSVTAPTLVVSGPESAGTPLNSKHDELAPRIFLDGHAILLSVSDSNPDVSGLVESRTQEVESEIEVAAVPLRALAANAVRIVILLCVGLALLATTVALVRHHQVWSTSLLLRCAVVALMVHAGMLYGFYFWIVSDDIVALAEKSAPAREVTVERILQAKLTEEALRLEVTALSAEAEIQAESRPPERMAALRIDEGLAPASVALPATVTPARALESAAQRPMERAVKEAVASFATPDTTPDPTPLAATLPAPVPAASSEAFDLPVPEGRSLKASTETPQPGPIASLKATASSSERVGESDLAPAETQVRSPAAISASLPPVARHAPEVPGGIITLLSVPAQATEVDLQAEQGAPLTSPKATWGKLDSTSSAGVDTGRLKVRIAEPNAAESPWRTPATGYLPSVESHAEARELPRATLAPSPALLPRPAQGSTLKLEEAAPLAEVASSEQNSASNPGPTPRPSERSAPPSAPRPGRAVSELVSVVSRPASGPLTMPSSTLDPPTQASEARLGAVPQPGVLRDAPLPRIERSSYRAQAAVLPDGSGGTEPGKGSPEVADVFAPRLSSKREWRPDLPSANPAKREDLQLESTPASALTPRASALESARLTPGPRDPSSVTTNQTPPVDGPRDALALSVEPKFPEAPPELRGEKDLRKVRSREGRQVLVGQMGGTQGSEDAVGLALLWLARHQSSDGRWDVDGFDSDCQSCRSPGVQVDCDAAVTALALLCFLGQNHTPSNPESPFRKQTLAAITWLLKNQGPDGSLAGADQRYTMYTHGIATLALSESLILTKDKRLEEPVRRAVSLIISSQNKTTGGWRYKPQPPIRGDTSITGWQVLALVSARGAGIQVPEPVLDRARHWLDNEVAGGQHGGIFGYTKPEEPRVAMTAEGMFARLLLGANRTDRNIEEAARYIHTETRGGGYLDNLYLLYYGNLALYHYQGWIWERWNTEVREFLIRAQQKSGTLTGSWDPTGPYTETGGRVLSTCFATLTLEVYYRYLPLYWTLDKAAK